jgi:hypothetical protein
MFVGLITYTFKTALAIVIFDIEFNSVDYLRHESRKHLTSKLHSKQHKPYHPFYQDSQAPSHLQ